MSMTTSADLIAAYLATKKVTKVPVGATCGMTAKDFYKAAREVKNDPADQRIEVCGGIQNGHGEWIYKD